MNETKTPATVNGGEEKRITVQGEHYSVPTLVRMYRSGKMSELHPARAVVKRLLQERKN